MVSVMILAVITVFNLVVLYIAPTIVTATNTIVSTIMLSVTMVMTSTLHR